MLQTIVCIDDESHNNEALERLLRKKYNVLTALTPADGLKLIEEHQPALIISDQRMPQMMGVELLKKSVELSPASIRILLTGYTDLESVIAAINEGEIYRYITKPWDTNDLTITVDKAVETHNLRQEVEKQNIQLQSLDRLKTEFMILVTHELRTPLAGISSFTELLLEEVAGDEHKGYLKHIEKNTNRLKKLIEDILIITKLKTESLKNTEDVNPQKIFADLWKAVGDKNLQLLCDGPAWSFDSNAPYFKEIFQRLITNINHYAAPGSAVSFHSDPTDASISISNMTAQPILVKAETLLNSFTKNENIMNHTQGNGLGLTVVKALTEALNGTLNISIQDKTFTITMKFRKSTSENN
jgi:two-component system, sensor histidine kinase and response regulator